MGFSNDLFCEAGSFSCCRPNPMGVFNQSFEALFPCAGALGCTVCFAPPTIPPGLSMHECGAKGSASCRTVCPIPQSTTLLGPPATTLLKVSSAPTAHLHPSYWYGGMFLLYLLGCQTSIQFDFLSVLVVIVFKLLLSFFWLCEEAQHVYLCLHIGQKP